MAWRNFFFLFWAASCKTSSGLLELSSVCPIALICSNQNLISVRCMFNLCSKQLDIFIIWIMIYFCFIIYKTCRYCMLNKREGIWNNCCKISFWNQVYCIKNSQYLMNSSILQYKLVKLIYTILTATCLFSSSPRLWWMSAVLES